MASSKSKWSSPELIATSAIAITSLAVNFYQYRAGQAAHLVGKFGTERTVPVTVTLDSGATKQIAPAATLVRFDNVNRGVHELLFEAPGFHATSMTVSVASPDDNWIARPIELASSNSPQPAQPSSIVPTI